MKDIYIYIYNNFNEMYDFKCVSFGKKKLKISKFYEIPQKISVSHETYEEFDKLWKFSVKITAKYLLPR